MPSLLLAVEAWVLGVLGWAWLAVRDLLSARPLLEEFVLYAGLGLTTVNLGLASVAPESRRGLFQAHLGAELALWLLLAYGLADAVDTPDTGAAYVPPPPVNNATAGVCCPNRQYALANRRLFFGGVAYYLLPGALSMALQSVQVLVAAGALVTDAHSSVWPGHGFALAALALFGALEAIRFLGPVTAPCPDGRFHMLFGLASANYGHVFACLSGGVAVLLALESLEMPHPLRLALRGGQLVVSSLLEISLCYALHGRGMLTAPALALLGVCWVPAVWALFEPCTPKDQQELVAQTAGCLKPKRRMRFVVPITTSTPKKRD